MDTLTAGVGTKTFARKDGFWIAPGIGVGERGGKMGCGVDMRRFHVNWGLGVWWQREGTRAYKILDLRLIMRREKDVGEGGETGGLLRSLAWKGWKRKRAGFLRAALKLYGRCSGREVCQVKMTASQATL